jgi:hypothetical protein
MKKLLLIQFLATSFFLSGCGHCYECDKYNSRIEVKANIEAAASESMTSANQKEAFMAIAVEGAKNGMTKEEWACLLEKISKSGMVGNDKSEVLVYITKNKNVIDSDELLNW